MNYTINQIKNRLQLFANNHLQLKGSIAFGEIEEVSNLGVVQFPYMFCTPQSSSFTERQFEFNMVVIIMDIVDKDLSNRFEIWSDVQLMFSDLRAFLNQEAEDDNYIISNSFNLTPFADRFTDDVTGWSGEIKFTISDLKDKCSLPIL